MKARIHIILPICLFVYLAIMAYVGRAELLVEKAYFSYFGKIALELGIIVMLYFVLKRCSRLRQQREEDMNGKNSDKQ